MILPGGYRGVEADRAMLRSLGWSHRQALGGAVGWVWASSSSGSSDLGMHLVPPAMILHCAHRGRIFSSVKIDSSRPTLLLWHFLNLEEQNTLSMESENQKIYIWVLHTLCNRKNKLNAAENLQVANKVCFNQSKQTQYDAACKSFLFSYHIKLLKDDWGSFL